MRLRIALPLALAACLVASCKGGGPSGTTSPTPTSSVSTSSSVSSSGGSTSLDWPCWRGPNADGKSTETGIRKDWNTRPPTLVWKVPMGDRGYAGPSVADGKVFIVDHEGNQDIVKALDLATGQERWRRPYEEPDGFDNGYARATPVYNAGKVYTLSHSGQLHCLDASSGAVAWRRDMVQEFGGQKPQWGMAWSPLVDGDKLIVIPGGPNAAVAALDKATGKTVWQGGGSDKPGYAAPVLATLGGKRQYVVFLAQAVEGVDTANGGVLWSFPWKTSYDVNAATPVVVGDAVFITSDYGHGGALVEPASSSARWQNDAIQSHFTSPILHDGSLYCTTDKGGSLTCLDAASGQVRWSQAGFEKGGVVAVDGVLIAQNGAGGDTVMVAMDPAGYKELGRFTPLGGKSWTAPIVARGKLLVRNEESLACYALR